MKHVFYALVGVTLALATVAVTALLVALMYVVSQHAPTVSAWAASAFKWTVVSGFAVLSAYSIYKMGALWCGDPEA